MTGWRSVGELLMTRRISLVAVCCSSASVSSRLRASSSWNRRAFSMAITAWSAKVWSSAICPVGEGLDFSTRDGDGPDRVAIPQHRHRQDGAERPLAQSAVDELGISGRVWHVDNGACQMARAVTLPRPGGIGKARRIASSSSGDQLWWATRWIKRPSNRMTPPFWPHTA